MSATSAAAREQICLPSVRLHQTGSSPVFPKGCAGSCEFVDAVFVTVVEQVEWSQALESTGQGVCAGINAILLLAENII